MLFLKCKSGLVIQFISLSTVEKTNEGIKSYDYFNKKTNIRDMTHIGKKRMVARAQKMHDTELETESETKYTHLRLYEILQR